MDISLISSWIFVSFIFGSCECLHSSTFSMSSIDLNVMIYLLGALVVSMIFGVCTFCFRRRKSFKKFENEAGLKDGRKNEYPIFRTLTSNDPTAIVPSEKTNFSRDNLLNSSENLISEGETNSYCQLPDDTNEITLIEKDAVQQQQGYIQPAIIFKQDIIRFENENIRNVANDLLISCASQPSQSSPLKCAELPTTQVESNWATIETETFTQLQQSQFDDNFCTENNDNGTSDARKKVACEGTFVILTNDETSADEIDGESSTSDKKEERSESICTDSSADDEINSIEEALRLLDNAIDGEDDDEDEDISGELLTTVENPNEYVERQAKDIVDCVVEECERILNTKEEEDDEDDENAFMMEVGMKNFSTPCVRNYHKNIESVDIEAKKSLFPHEEDLDEDEIKSPLPNSETFVLQVEQCDSNNENEEASSADLTTITPVNTPIEYSKRNLAENDGRQFFRNDVIVDSDVPFEKAINFSNDGWFMNPDAESVFQTFIYDDDDNEDERQFEAEGEDLTSTFNQLRQQLTEMLPHAQGMSQHNDFFDSENNDDSSTDNYGDFEEVVTSEFSSEIVNVLPDPIVNANEMHINYKRSLSPIMEESEIEETCQTFCLNNVTRPMDSTSTGVDSASAEAAAMMGQVPKALLASNDTLFNFEDTLSDHTDTFIMSPKIHKESPKRIKTQKIDSAEVTPTNEEPPSSSNFYDNVGDIMKNSIRNNPLHLDLDFNNDELKSKKLQLKTAWSMELPEAQQVVNDLASPDQNFTGESLSFEQDLTYTVDEMKTCVTLRNDEERISEISEPTLASGTLDDEADYELDKNHHLASSLADLKSLISENNEGIMSRTDSFKDLLDESCEGISKDDGDVNVTLTLNDEMIVQFEKEHSLESPNEQILSLGSCSDTNEERFYPEATYILIENDDDDDDFCNSNEDLIDFGQYEEKEEIANEHEKNNELLPEKDEMLELEELKDDFEEFQREKHEDEVEKCQKSMEIKIIKETDSKHDDFMFRSGSSGSTDTLSSSSQSTADLSNRSSKVSIRAEEPTKVFLAEFQSEIIFEKCKLNLKNTTTKLIMNSSDEDSGFENNARQIM